MDLFLATCQGIGLALAAGALAGALDGATGPGDRPGALGYLLLALGVVGGAVLFGASLAAEDHPAWPGLPVGALIALLALSVAQGVVRGAAARAQGGASAGALAAYAIVGAAVLAGLSVVTPPVALVALVAVVWLAIARRRREGRKYEGLRVLR